jgi:hypothetical protein
MKSQQRAQSLAQRRAALLQNSRPPIARYATSKAGAIKGAAPLISNGVTWGLGQVQVTRRHPRQVGNLQYDRIFACNARSEQCTAASARARRRYPPRCLPLLAAELTRFTVRLHPSVSPAAR